MAILDVVDHVRVSLHSVKQLLRLSLMHCLRNARTLVARVRVQALDLELVNNLVHCFLLRRRLRH